jgi:uncharacterized protein GlcG (DUF336 family)
MNLSNSKPQLVRLISAASCSLFLSVIGSTSVADDVLQSFRGVKLEAAVELAQVAMEACREGGYQVAVAVVDRSGLVQVLVRDQLAGPHTLDAARRKAWTAASFKADTRSIADATRSGTGQSGARFVNDAMMVSGGVPLYGEGVLLGAIGVSGTPSADEDQKCADQGADALQEKLLF